MVTPHAGVWIEIQSPLHIAQAHQVTPHAGVWIEILKAVFTRSSILVTPHAGVWIEIVNGRMQLLTVYESRPTRACGLKLLSTF